MGVDAAPPRYIVPSVARNRMYRELTLSPRAIILAPGGSGMMTVERLGAFFDEGWNRHDVDVLMTFMTDDCVFESAAGPEVCGTRHAGREAVRAAFARVLAGVPDVVFRDARHVVAGDRGLSEWIFTGTRADGTKIEVNGCDVFTFRDDKIAVKTSYLKQRVRL
jgi:ketosteroid isomerase-like protein